MTRQALLIKISGVINQHNVNQIYTALYDLAYTSVLAQNTVKHPLSQSQYQCANKALIAVYYDNGIAVMKNLRKLLILGEGSYLSEEECTKILAILMLYKIRRGY